MGPHGTLFVWRNTGGWPFDESGGALPIPEHCPWCETILEVHQLGPTTWSYYQYASWCPICGWYLKHEDFGYFFTAAELRHFDVRSPELAISELGAYLKNHPIDLYGISWRQLEKLVEDIFRELGYSTVLTRMTRDGGADILVYYHERDDLVAIVECKKYAEERKVGVSAVKQLIGTSVDWGVRRAYLVTTSEFTKVAREKALHFRGKGFDLELVPATELLKMLKVYNDAIPPLNKLNAHIAREVISSYKALNLTDSSITTELDQTDGIYDGCHDSESRLRKMNLSNLSSTSWSGSDLLDAEPWTEPFFRLKFLENGELQYTDNGYLRSGGSWRQNGALVIFEMNQGFAKYTGGIDGDRMEGQARNEKGLRWRWSVKRER
jgi:hypothetical protein